MDNSNPQNYSFHQILEQDIENLKGGLLTFTVRVNNGAVSDYILIRYDKKFEVSPADRKRD
ncbi:hypothetical protein K0A96_00065 [Patescibacteria group bacterium]|nr:hypothetical protein [Patescibacteria group bacterium]